MTAHGPENALIARVLAQPGSAAQRDSPEPRGADLDWDHLARRAEIHGLAPLLLHHAAALGLALPEPARARLEGVAAHCRGRAKKCQFTLYRLLEAGARRGLETTLLKGAALVGSVYPDPRLRPMDDVDLLVRPESLALARAVAAEIGLGPGTAQLPSFYYRLVHFAQALEPALDPLVPIDLHWRLHSPALLLTDRIEELWARRRAVTVYGHATAVLDPADQWLHLATHFWSHWGHTPARTPELALLVEEPGVAIALKWLVDLVAATGRLAAECPPEALAQRAAEWSAQAEAATTLALVEPLLAAPGPAFARAVRDAVGGTSPARRSRRDEATQQAGQAAHPGLGFRIGTFRRLPAWILPPESYLRAAARLARPASGPTLLRLRAAHAARVLARAALAALALPPALLLRLAARRGRAQRIRAARSPARVVELLRGFRAFEAAYAERFALDRPGDAEP